MSKDLLRKIETLEARLESAPGELTEEQKRSNRSADAGERGTREMGEAGPAPESSAPAVEDALPA